MADIAEFKQASHTASRLERLGEYAEAAQYWQVAYFAASGKVNEHWCETRRNVCLNAAARLEEGANEMEIQNERDAGYRDACENFDRSHRLYRGRGF